MQLTARARVQVDDFAFANLLHGLLGSDQNAEHTLLVCCCSPEL